MQNKFTKMNLILLFILVIKAQLVGMSTDNEIIKERIRRACFNAALSKLERKDSVDSAEAYSPHDGLPEFHNSFPPATILSFLYLNPEKIESCCALYILNNYPEDHIIIQLCTDKAIINSVLSKFHDSAIISSTCEGINLLQRATLVNNINAIDYLCNQRKDVFSKLINIGTEQQIPHKNFIFPRKSTPLHISIALGFFDLALILLQNGANANSQDEQNKFPRDYLKKYDGKENAQVFAQISKLLYK